MHCFAMMEQKNYNKILPTFLYVRELTVNDDFYSAIETTLSKSPVLYRYTEITPKTFPVSTEVQSQRHEDVFIKERIRKFAIAMKTNEAFLGAKRLNPFHFQKFNLTSITCYRNDCPVARTPLQTESHQKLVLLFLQAPALGNMVMEFCVRTTLITIF